MLKQAPIQALAALASLNESAEFEPVLKWLRESLEEIRTDSATTKDEVLMRWQQGGMQVLAELIEKSAGAKELMFKLQRK